MGGAMHPQRQVPIQIVLSGGDYTWFAKDNQPQMEEDNRPWFASEIQPIPRMGLPPKDFETAQQTNKGHWRLETRTFTVRNQLKKFSNWPYQEQVFVLERRFVFLKTGEIQEQSENGFISLRRAEMAPIKWSR